MLNINGLWKWNETNRFMYLNELQWIDKLCFMYIFYNPLGLICFMLAIYKTPFREKICVVKDRCNCLNTLHLLVDSDCSQEQPTVGYCWPLYIDGKLVQKLLDWLHRKDNQGAPNQMLQLEARQNSQIDLNRRQVDMFHLGKLNRLNIFIIRINAMYSYSDCFLYDFCFTYLPSQVRPPDLLWSLSLRGR